MEQEPIRAVEMVREIRDRLYEETKQLSREEFRDFVARESGKKTGGSEAGSSGQSAA